MILEKIVLLVVSYFSVGTEMRFLKDKKRVNLYSKKDAEMWHAKALHTAMSFLPTECPLVQHILNSYNKHYMRVKEE